MRKVVFGINITADGYCSHEDGIVDAELHQYFTEMLRNTDVILYGRKTYQLMVPYWPDVAKNQSEDEASNEFARIFDSLNLLVFSTTLKEVAGGKTRIVRGNIAEEVNALKNRTGKNIAVGSLSIASQLSDLGLIDEYHFVVHPIVAGKGPRLFETFQSKNSLRLDLIGTKKLQSGVVALQYIKHKGERMNSKEKTAQDIIVTREFNSSLEQVWKAITDKEIIRRWYFDLAEFKAEVGFKFQFSGGPSPDKQYLHLCEVTEVIPNKKLTYSWRYDGYSGISFITFELSPKENTTQLKFIHKGIDSFPMDNPDFAIGNFTEGWNYIIHTSLKDYVENVDKEIFSSRTFNAPRDLVWEVWTNPNHTALWWGPKGFTNTIYEMNVKPGGIFKFMMHGPDGVDFPNIITYVEVVKPERLVYNHGNYENPEIFFVTINFLEDNGKTKITMRMIFKTAEERREVVEKYGALEGQKQHLDKLDAYLAKMLKTKQ